MEDIQVAESDFDSPWKEAVSEYLQPFLQMFFLEAHRDIDWSRGYEILDKELQKIAPQAESGRLEVDVLAKVFLHNGEDRWVLVHVEVQSQPGADFPRRMFTYHVRISDFYQRPVASFAVLADERMSWRPHGYAYNLWGCEMSFRFPTVKLLDFVNGEDELAQSENPFAVVVLAHLKAQQTRDDHARRRVWKVRLVRGLYQRGWTREQVWKLIRLIDWFLRLPKPLERLYLEDVAAIESETHMPYVTSFERLAREEGEAHGRAEGEAHGRAEGEAHGRAEGLRESICLLLRIRFGIQGETMVSQIQGITDLDRLRQLTAEIVSASSLDEFRQSLEGSA